MNYFNYFTEIEQEFVRRRGSHMLVSPLDWSLIEMWKQRDIPLHVVLRGINSSFDSYESRPHRGRKVNSLFYCQQEVEATYQQYVESRVGSNPESENGATNGENGGNQFSQSTLIDYLTDNRRSIELLRDKQATVSPLREALDRAADRLGQVIDDLGSSSRISAEALEKDLTMIENLILDGARAASGDEMLVELKKEGNRQLKVYKQTMEREIFEQTLANFIDRRLRETYGLPRLSLFYL
ncbi:MAG: hypothetical protein AB7H86_13120 [Blastocatellales bacterium]